MDCPCERRELAPYTQDCSDQITRGRQRLCRNLSPAPNRSWRQLPELLSFRGARRRETQCPFLRFSRAISSVETENPEPRRRNLYGKCRSEEHTSELQS